MLLNKDLKNLKFKREFYFELIKKNDSRQEWLRNIYY